jgi:hypothetical protein
LERVSLPANVAKVPVVGRVTFVAPLEVRVIELAPEVTKLEPSAKVKVALLEGAVIVTLLMLVAVATPKEGVVRLGELAKTRVDPLPVVVLPNKVNVPEVSGKV